MVQALVQDPGQEEAGLTLTVTALLADSYDPDRMNLATERLEQTLEECVELAAALSYLSALLLPLFTRLAESAPEFEDDVELLDS